MSRPPWARGLKLTANTYATAIYVAPPVGAWIETALGCAISRNFEVAPPVGAWIETPPRDVLGLAQRRAPRGRVD